MKNERIYYLLNGYLNSALTPLETEELQLLLLEDNTALQVKEGFPSIIDGYAAAADYRSEEWDPIADHILSESRGIVLPVLPTRPKRRTRLLRTWTLIAAVFVCMVAGTYVWLRYSGSGSGNRQAKRQQPRFPGITPGKEGAVLTLADGSQVVLDSVGNSVVASQQGTAVVMKNGQLSYGGAATGEQVYNTVTTPKGRQFRLRLADGTQVWLNAASSLHFPAAFAGKERKVEVTGEVYFEVADNASMPFRVMTKERAEIHVLGTAFNVNAYEDEAATKVTLVGGAIQVSNGMAQKLLQPGQQATLAEGKTVVTEVDVEKVVAWKNGVFSFGKEVSLEDVMRQVARWYDIEVKYEGNINRRQFGGKINRAADIEKVLEVLEESGIRYRINGREITIMP
ncbi:FecR family protein [Filimonas effusa]|uniref:FecR family protein n=1 Tax=Filimonas effusa TaxID=2508721 RepID=A0A4Q1D558_9BACT|nr:FecR domain-containing protein [Filimonas effusa]RXK83620.1 FecR family protein [Filimonas effusa]